MRSFFAILVGATQLATAQPPVLYSTIPQTGVQFTRSVGDADWSGEFLSLGGDWSVPASSITQSGTAYWGPSAGSLFASQFPNTNWLLKETWPGGYRYRYYALNTNGLRLAGEVAPAGTTAYTISRSVLFFPMYLDYESFGGYQIQGQPVSSYSYGYGSYGTLTLGQNSFDDVIQIVGNDHITFWNSDPLYPIVMLETEEWPFDWTIFIPGLVNVEELGPGAVSFAPYPNPSSGIVHVDRHPSETSYSVVDMLGKVVLTGTRTNEILDLTSLAAGSYQVYLNGPRSTKAIPVIKTDRDGQ